LWQAHEKNKGKSKLQAQQVTKTKETKKKHTNTCLQYMVAFFIIIIHI
jgi:hypothetical protein